MKTTKLLSLFFCLSTIKLLANDCNCDFVITPENYQVKYNTLYDNIDADTICIKGGVYERIWFEGFHGSEEKPLVITNCEGQVVLKHAENKYGGFNFINCTYIHVTGTGDPEIVYGLKVNNTLSGSGISFNTFSSNIEIDHVEIANTGFAGLVIKSDPYCNDPNTWRGNFLMENIFVHDNYIHDTQGEGMYIGSTKTVDCEGQQDKIRGHYIRNLKIYNNVVERTGWDGIQVANANEEFEVYNNEVRDYATRNSGGHKHGILMGGYTSGKSYNNFVYKGTGPGMTTFGLGDIYMFNNIIVEAGSYGIFCDDRSTDPNKGFHFINNTIVKPVEDGIRMYSYQSKGNVFYNNLIVEPGSYDTYENATSWWGTGLDSYIYVNDVVKYIDYDTAGNHYVRFVEDANFVNWKSENFNLLEESSAIDQGIDVINYGINFDYNNWDRPNNQYDAGAFEFYTDSVGLPVQEGRGDLKIYPNPLESGETLNLEFTLSRISNVQIKVFNINGGFIEYIVNDITYKNGFNSVNYEFKNDLAKGVYFIVLEHLGGRRFGRLVVI